MTEQAAAPATDTSREPLTIHQAVALLDAQDAAAKATPAPATAEEKSAATASTDTADQAPEDEAGEVEQEQPEDGDEPEAEPEPEDTDDDPTVALPDGSEVKLSEMAKGYLRQSDYTRKTQALAEERKTFDAAKKQHADTVRQVEQALSARVAELEAAAKARDQYSQMVGLLESRLNEQGAEWAKVDWQGKLRAIATARQSGDAILAADLSAEYTTLYGQYQLHQQAQQAVAAEKAKARAERDAEEAKRRDEWHAQQVQQRQQAEARAKEHMFAKYPDLADPAKAPKLVGDLLETARALGYSEDEIQQTLDPRGIDLWWMATQWRLSKAKASNVTQQTAQKPATPPSGVRIIKGNAPRPRALTVERGKLGGSQAAFNAAPTLENALAVANARTVYAQKTSR